MDKINNIITVQQTSGLLQATNRNSTYYKETKCITRTLLTFIYTLTHKSTITYIHTIIIITIRNTDKVSIFLNLIMKHVYFTCN